jgi:hypothetical protein
VVRVLERELQDLVVRVRILTTKSYNSLSRTLTTKSYNSLSRILTTKSYISLSRTLTTKSYNQDLVVRVLEREI